MLVASEWANCKRDRIVGGDRMLCVEMLCLLLLRLMIERCTPLFLCKTHQLSFDKILLSACEVNVQDWEVEFGDSCIAQI